MGKEAIVRRRNRGPKARNVCTLALSGEAPFLKRKCGAVLRIKIKSPRKAADARAHRLHQPKAINDHEDLRVKHGEILTARRWLPPQSNHRPFVQRLCAGNK